MILFSLKSSKPFYSLTILYNVYPLRTYLRNVIYAERWRQLVSVTEGDLIRCPFQSNLSSEEEAVSQSVPVEHIMRGKMSMKLRTSFLVLFCSVQPSLEHIWWHWVPHVDVKGFWLVNLKTSRPGAVGNIHETDTEKLIIVISGPVEHNTRAWQGGDISFWI